MFIHAEDKGEIEMKICTDGILVAHCPTCQRLWAVNLSEIQTNTNKSVTVSIKGVQRSSRSIEVGDKASRKKFNGKTGNLDSKITESAKKAFPALFH